MKASAIRLLNQKVWTARLAQGFLWSAVSSPLVSAEILLTLKKAFIAKHKNRAEINVDFTIDKAGKVHAAKDDVVDVQFRVHRFENLYVCDASIFPTIISIRPQLTIMAPTDFAGVECIGKA